MESRQPITESQNACPSCRTRLRVSLKAESKTEFDCPECGVALVARSTENGDVEVSTAANAQELTPPTQGVLRLHAVWSAKSRTIAAAVTASFGFLLVIYLTTSDRKPVHRSARDANGTVGNAGTETVAGSNKSNQPPGGMTGSERDATAAMPVASNHETNSPSRRHTEVGSENATTSSSKAAPTDSELASTILNEPPIALTLPTIGDEKPTRPAGSVQLITGNEETDRSDPPGHPDGNGATAKTDDSKVATHNPTDKEATKPMNVRQRLEISILSFRQTKPVPLRELIRTVEQMCRVRVDVSAASDEQLETPVTLSLTKTTPATILAEAGRKSGLRVIVGEDSVRLVPTEE
ncbi:MAG: putative RNA-binding Zn-ribbon protein involved in translation (DUF1610 family) [Planctomycetaceae bacterium]|jgi:predicted RNA-binding Zn-ribbon protein involved in translation (DUF1610 family)